MKVVVTAGGTGGHIYPALSIIENVLKDAEVLYIGTNDRMEKEIVPKRGINYVSLDIKGLNRNNIFKNLEVLYKFIKSYFKSRKILKEFNPEMVIGCGGYVTLPVLKAAQSLKIKTFIHEQNSELGLSNKLISKKSKVMLSLATSKMCDNYYLVGNPRSEEVKEAKKANLKKYEFDEKPVVLIVMGSLGSSTINEKLKEVLENLDDKYNYILVTGKDYFEDFKNKDQDNLKIVSYIDEMPSVLKAVDIVITRAGATMITEIIASGVVPVFVPSPYVSNNHQMKNALYLVKNEAGFIIKEEDFNTDLINKTLNEALEKSSSIKKNLEKLEIKDVYKNIEKVLGI